MESGLHREFIETLENYYGDWHKVTSKFGNYSFGEISDELCVSPSQFSKLISGSATEGMYTRSIKNIEQLKYYKQLAAANANLKEEIKISANQPAKRRSSLYSILKYLAIGLLGLVLGAVCLTYYQRTYNAMSALKPVDFDEHPLAEFFDQKFNSDFVSPYLYEYEVQAFCPCNAYEGTWRLENDYKIPLPTKKAGVYYVAKSSDMRLKCKRSALANQKGKVLVGFENMLHEIWVDRDKNPFSTEYFDNETKKYKKEFLDMKFEENDRFTKVAEIHSFFLDEVIISKDSISRSGEPCGRYVNVINQELANEYELDFKNLLKNIIGNMTITNCTAAVNSFCDPNTLVENESVISFDCRYTIKTENLGMGGSYPYSKGFRLIKQNYSDHVMCECQ